MPRGLRRFQESGQSHLDPSASRDFGSGQTPARRLNFQLLVSSALFRNGRGVRSVCSLRGGHAPSFRAVRLWICCDAGFAQVSAQNRGANLGHPAIHYLKLSFANGCEAAEFTVKLRYLHRNPVKRGLVLKPEEWKWSSYRHYALWETGSVEIESEWTARDREQKACGAAGRIFLRPG